MNITEGKIEKAQKVVIYGPEGIGKSTFASSFPDPIFIDTEGSTAHLNVKRFDAPSSWEMLLQQINFVMTEKPCRTLVIDTADWAERLCKDFICAKGGAKIKGIEDFGYGKGYTYLAEEWGRMLNFLQDVVDSGINVVITAHAMMRKFEQPEELGAFDRWELKLEKKTSPLTKEWADMVLFANYEVNVVNVDGQGAQKGKNKAQGGKRVMYTSHHPVYDAKNRSGLNEKLSFSFEEIQHLFTKDFRQKTNISKEPEQTIEQQREDIQEIQTEVPEEFVEEKVVKDDLSDIPKELKDLMVANNVTKEEIQKAVFDRGYFPIDTRVEDYPIDFVQGVLVGAWNQVYKIIEDNRVPF